MARAFKSVILPASALLAFCSSMYLGGAARAASRYDRWNGSGFALTHGSRTQAFYSWGSRVGKNADSPDDKAVSSAVSAQKACKPVILYTDAGPISQPADGCRK